MDDEGADQQADHAATQLPDAVFPTEDAKFDAVVAEDRSEMLAAGRPVLIGTRSVEESKKLSREADGGWASTHQVLNAEQNEDEAEIVVAGRPAGHGDGGDEHGRPRHRHQARRRAWRRPAGCT